MVRGPEANSESYERFIQEETAIYEGLKRRAEKLVTGLNAIDGISCQPAEGAMYAFPRIHDLPEKAYQEASSKEQTIDTLYALSLLHETGICVVPASGFGQASGRVGFRTTFLPNDTVLDKAMDEFARHHDVFMKKYS